MQAYVDQEEFFISQLSMEDVILGVPWFHCMAAILQILSPVIMFMFRNQEISIHREDRESTIPIVLHASLHK